MKYTIDRLYEVDEAIDKVMNFAIRDEQRFNNIFVDGSAEQELMDGLFELHMEIAYLISQAEDKED